MTASTMLPHRHAPTDDITMPVAVYRDDMERHYHMGRLEGLRAAAAAAQELLHRQESIAITPMRHHVEIREESVR